MWLASLLRYPKPGTPRSRRARGRRPVPSPTPRFVPRLEALEDRALPSTYTVLNLHDGGAGSLRQAVLDADAHPGHNTIGFAHGLHGTIALTSGELDITGDLTIHGPGVNRLTVSGNDASRVFEIAAG